MSDLAKLRMLLQVGVGFSGGLLNRFRGCGAERVAIERQRRVNGAFVVVARSVEMRFE